MGDEGQGGPGGANVVIAQGQVGLQQRHPPTAQRAIQLKQHHLLPHHCPPKVGGGHDSGGLKLPTAQHGGHQLAAGDQGQEGGIQGAGIARGVKDLDAGAGRKVGQGRGQGAHQQGRVTGL